MAEISFLVNLAEATAPVRLDVLLLLLLLLMTMLVVGRVPLCGCLCSERYESSLESDFMWSR